MEASRPLGDKGVLFCFVVFFCFYECDSTEHSNKHFLGINRSFRGIGYRVREKKEQSRRIWPEVFSLKNEELDVILYMYTGRCGGTSTGIE